METKKSLSYLRAKKKVETLKHFYSHLAVFIIINTGIILILGNAFGKGDFNLSNWGIYITAFMWGIGLVCHAIFVVFELYFKNGFLRRWEDRKIQQILEDEDFKGN